MPATRLRIFISSVQKEFAQLRRNLKAFLLGDAVLQRFVADVFLFEELPAKDRRADEVYIGEVEHCNIYLGIFGYEYGFEDQNGVSPTEHEYDHATRHGKTRLVYVWGSDDKKRAPKMRQLISKASGQLIRRRVDDVSALTAKVYASLVDYLDSIGIRGSIREPATNPPNPPGTRSAQALQGSQQTGHQRGHKGDIGDFAEFTEANQIESNSKAKVEAEFNRMIDSFSDKSVALP